MPTTDSPTSSTLNSAAESYVRLVLSLGEHDSDYVDAYSGPPAWRDEAKTAAASLDALRSSAEQLIQRLGAIHTYSETETIQLRHQYLRQQSRSVLARIDMLRGRKFSFEEEAHALYDARPPRHKEEFFRKVLSELDGLIPGTGPIAVRFDQYRKDFIIPVEKLNLVFQIAIQECRSRTLQNIELPGSERFTLEYVTNKTWSGYNWYKGDSNSLIQINTDLPIYIDRAVDLAAHEGYPGHHVYNSMLELHLARERGWVEFTVYALFSPQSLIAEGTANFGIEVAFPGLQRVEFERNVLFPAAGMDAQEADRYYLIHRLTTSLNYAHNEAARGYLDGVMDRRQAEEWLVTYALMSPERAQQRVRFIDTYRSYVINYNLGQDLVRRYIESRGGTADNPKRRWEEFKKLISSPRLPSGL
jgi:hypothetical protein